MLLRQDEHGWLAIGQPSHAWLSGQLARAWGNQRFGGVEPLEEVCLAAEQHDVGWGDRDLEPLLARQEGRPRSFMEMPLDLHLDMFTRGPRRMLSQSRYAALLVSLHGWRLYERRDLDRASPEDAAAIRSFLSGQESFQRELLDTLREDPATSEMAQDAVVERNSLLIWTWDYLSLALCLGWDPATAKGAPAAEGRLDLALERERDGERDGDGDRERDRDGDRDGDADGDRDGERDRDGDRDRDGGGDNGVWRLDPWPFVGSSLTVRCEGRRLQPGFASEASLRQAFSAASWETLEFRLEPRGPENL
jgi:hypothetical protein